MPACTQCQTSFEITPEDREFLKIFQADQTGLCFECSHKNRLSFRNERVLYHRKCDFSGESILSIYSPDKPYKIYKTDIWHGDKWDPLDFGQEFDGSQNFFDQYEKLQKKVPRAALFNIRGENSDYCNFTIGNKNCYLVFGGDFNEDVMFGTLCMHNQDVLDCDYSNGNKFCYILNDSINCYGSTFTFDSKNCTDCHFISDCSNCSDCILCTNLQNKSYCLNNIQLSKDEYFEKKALLLCGSFKQQEKNFHDFLQMRNRRIVKHAHTISCENSTGDYLKSSKNCQNCYDVSDSQDLRNVFFGSKAKDSFDTTLVGENAELIYNCLSCLGSYNIRQSIFVVESSDIEYSEQITNSRNLFGCIGLKHKEYCILNRQYTKEKYEEIRKEIENHMRKTGEWGKFFPQKLSCFGYNESPAVEHYPLTKDQAINEGFRWYEKRKDEVKATELLNIPDSIRETSDDIIKQIITCQSCQKNFRIIHKELEFYRKMNLPAPQNCPECRHAMRLSLRNPRKLYTRTCAKCAVPIQTTYAPERPEKVYCEACYLKEVY